MSNLRFNLRIGRLFIQLERGPWFPRHMWVTDNGTAYGRRYFQSRLRIAISNYEGHSWTGWPIVRRYE